MKYVCLLFTLTIAWFSPQHFPIWDRKGSLNVRASCSNGKFWHLVAWIFHFVSTISWECTVNMHEPIQSKLDPRMSTKAVAMGKSARSVICLIVATSGGVTHSLMIHYQEGRACPINDLDGSPRNFGRRNFLTQEAHIDCCSLPPEVAPNFNHLGITSDWLSKSADIQRCIAMLLANYRSIAASLQICLDL